MICDVTDADADADADASSSSFWPPFLWFPGLCPLVPIFPLCFTLFALCFSLAELQVFAATITKVHIFPIT